MWGLLHIQVSATAPGCGSRPAALARGVAPRPVPAAGFGRAARQFHGRAVDGAGRLGAFRAQLGNHHSAEDDDLWPVLRRELSDPGELALVDAMVEEHRHIPAALDGVDAAFRAGDELAAPAELLSSVVLDHLAHEERDVPPSSSST